MKKILLVLTLSSLIVTACSQNSESGSVEIVINNPTELKLVDQYVEIDLTKIESFKNVDELKFIVTVDDKEIASQLVGKNKIGFVTDFDPNEEKIAVLEFGKDIEPMDYQDRTYAEIAMKVDSEFKDGKYLGGRFENFQKVRVPDGHTDHNALFKYEGPGWESEKIGYRMYIDWRNRTDIFGKKTNELVLKQVGVNDLDAKDDSYHNMQTWGKDIFKVGSSFGIGSFGMMAEDSIYMVSERDSLIVEITENGPVVSTVNVNYFGWQVGESKYDLESNLSITAGSRLTEVELSAANIPDNFVTGLAKHPGTEFKVETVENGWSFISVYGAQTMADYGQPEGPVDKLGIAVIFNDSDLIEQTETEDSYVVMLKPIDGQLNYYFGAAWEQEPGGIKTAEEFYEYINDVIESLNNPITLNY